MERFVTSFCYIYSRRIFKRKTQPKWSLSNYLPDHACLVIVEVIKKKLCSLNRASQSLRKYMDNGETL